MKARLHRYAHSYSTQGFGRAKHCGQGFTFIELMVTVAITMFLFTGLIAGYNRFTDASRIKQVCLSFKNDLRLAQNKAMSGEKPLNLVCNELVGYQVSFTKNSYTTQARCNPVQSSAPETTITLPKNVTFSPVPSPTPPVTFGVLTQGININTDMTFTLVSGNHTCQLRVTPNGEITDVILPQPTIIVPTDSLYPP